ncbi:PepSY-associated TM helix domain-containing protein [Cupriavidus basilensis]
MLLFAVTGFTLNHAGQIEARPQVVTRTATAPASLTAALRQARHADKGPVPAALGDRLARELDIDAGGREAEWSGDEIYVALPRPGGDAWVSLALDSGEVQYEKTTRGWISLPERPAQGPQHRPRLEPVPRTCLAAACLIFSITPGCVLLKLHAGGRMATWPLVGLGLGGAAAAGPAVHPPSGTASGPCL